MATSVPSESIVVGRPAQPVGGYGFVRRVLGVVLITSSVIKGYDLAAEAIRESTVPHWQSLVMLWVVFELFLGTWLLRGVHAARAWRLSLMCFSLLACVALFQALAGWASCGCFGQLKASPWFVATFDVLAVAALLRWPP